MPADSEPALQFDNVTCRFGNYTAVQNVSLTVKEGEFLSVVGPTGCGKSTLLNIAAGVRTFDHVVTLAERRLLGWRRT